MRDPRQWRDSKLGMAYAHLSTGREKVMSEDRGKVF
jgi:hypothetical protein